jgi:four helix bundle protein
MGKQLLRSATSVGAHYRESCRARSPAEFVSKLEVALQELDESLYWMELLVEGEIVPAPKLEALCKEANELIAILVTSINTSKRNN